MLSLFSFSLFFRIDYFVKLKSILHQEKIQGLRPIMAQKIEMYVLQLLFWPSDVLFPTKCIFLPKCNSENVLVVLYSTLASVGCISIAIYYMHLTTFRLLSVYAKVRENQGLQSQNRIKIAKEGNSKQNKDKKRHR